MYQKEMLGGWRVPPVLNHPPLPLLKKRLIFINSLTVECLLKEMIVSLLNCIAFWVDVIDVASFITQEVGLCKRCFNYQNSVLQVCTTKK